MLQSTRDDVERLLGQTKYKGFSTAYDLEGGHLDVEYAASNFCEHGDDLGWNVDEWTVIEVTFSPDASLQFSSLKLDLKQFRKVQENPCCPDVFTFRNDKEGVAYTVNPGGILNTIEYFPSSQLDYLRCRKEEKGTP